MRRIRWRHKWEGIPSQGRTPLADGLQVSAGVEGPARRPVRSASGRRLSEFVKDTSHGFSDRFRVVFMRTLIEIWFLAVIVKLPNGSLQITKEIKGLAEFFFVSLLEQIPY